MAKCMVYPGCCQVRRQWWFAKDNSPLMAEATLLTEEPSINLCTMGGHHVGNVGHIIKHVEVLREMQFTIGLGLMIENHHG